MTNTARKTTLLSSIGAGLEYYDFIVYGMMAEYLSALFFPGDSEWLSLMKTFAIFAIGYLIRPCGGILFGLIGDTSGRKATFLAVMFLMAFATLAIGLLPTYALIGSVAPCLLLLLRVCQGISLGGEIPGALTVVCESTEKRSQGFYASYLISSTGIGSALATLVLFLLSSLLSREQILDWGWRIPFLLGGLLAIANYFIRRHLQETPEFVQLQLTRSQQALGQPLITLLRHYRGQIGLGIGTVWLVATLVIFSLYLPTYLTQHFRYSLSDVYFAITCGTLWSSLILPFCGYLADKWGRERTLVIGSIVFATTLVPLFLLLHYGSFALILLFTVVLQTFIALLTASALPILANLFSAEVRYTGIAACYNITYSIMGCSPLLLTVLIRNTQSPNCAIWHLIACATITTITGSLLLLRARPLQRGIV